MQCSANSEFFRTMVRSKEEQSELDNQPRWRNDEKKTMVMMMMMETSKHAKKALWTLDPHRLGAYNGTSPNRLFHNCFTNTSLYDEATSIDDIRTRAHPVRSLISTYNTEQLNFNQATP